MKPTQYILSLNTLYRAYSKNLPVVDYDYLADLIDHYSDKETLNQKEAEEAETKCKEEWKKFILLFLKKNEKNLKKYQDIIKEEEKKLTKIKTKIEINKIPLGDYENEWDEVDTIYRKIFSKINAEERNIRRNWIGHIISFILGIIATLITTWIFRGFLGW